MRKNLKNLAYTLLFVSVSILNQSCKNEIIDDVAGNNSALTTNSEELNVFGSDDLTAMRVQLEKEGIDIPTIELEAGNDSIQTKGIIVNNPFVRAIKVSTKTLHPNRLGGIIDVSGVLLVPKKTIFNALTNYRIIVATPPTYTYNDLAPSNAFKKMSMITSNKDLNFLYFWTLQAVTGFAVFIPDYPGFGDSYKQCFHPYLDSKALVNSTIDLIKAAQYKLSSEGYKYKKELMITGYSQGGYAAASLARELETNPKHGYSVKLLVTGGTPCNLKQIADIVRYSDNTVHTFFLPYGLWGYKLNAYPQVEVRQFLQEPFATTSLQYYDGTYKDVNEKFPHKVSELYTEKFLKYLDIDSDVSYMNQILDENSVKPWKNKCKFVMTHGVSDVSVYYQNAKDFAEKQNNNGGKVSFISTAGDHILGIVPYYAKATFYLGLYK